MRALLACLLLVRAVPLPAQETFDQTLSIQQGGKEIGLYLGFQERLEHRYRLLILLSNAVFFMLALPFLVLTVEGQSLVGQGVNV